MPAIDNLEHVGFELGGQELEVVSLAGEERLSRLFRFTVECNVAGPPPKALGLIGQPAVLTLRDGAGTERRVTGIATEATSRALDNHQARLRVEVRPAAYALAVGRDCCAFQDSTVVDIVKDVMTQVPAPSRWSLGRDYPKRAYTVQYREDDWTFVSRLLEEAGIYYWFDHADGSTLEFADDSTAAPDAPGGAPITFAYQSGAKGDADVVEELACGVHVVPEKFTVGSFDPERPLLTIRESVGDGRLEIYDARGGGLADPALCAALAETRRQAAGAAKTTLAGVATSVRLYPGVVFELENHPLHELEGRYLVTQTSYRVTQRTQAGAPAPERPYQCDFTAIRAATPYRAPEETAPAKQIGAQSGIVVGPPGEEIHTDSLGRVRVQQHWDRLGTRDDKSGKWMRVSQRGSAESLLFPRMGWTVLTFNEEGSIDAPSVFNRIPDGEHLPPYPLPANKTRLVYKTATTPGGGSFNEIRFEDKRGVEEMFLNASRDMVVYVQHLKNETIERDHRREVGVDHSLTVNQDYFRFVGRDQTMTIGANETLEASAGASREVRGNETIGIGGTRKLTTGSDHTTAGEKNRTLTVGAALIDVSLGPIGQDGGFTTLLVGGAMLQASLGTITDDCGKVAMQLIGGARLESARGNRTIDVKKVYAETVGGSLLLKADGTYIDNADETLKWKVGGALNASGKSVWVEAKDKIVLKCGESTVTIVPDSIEIKSPTFELDAAALQYETGKVTHN